MIIRALRVAECGRFDQPVALERMSGSLDLLVGPNETGKSTLLKALKACLFFKHRSADSALSALRPYRGGAPLIEIDLETGGSRWRIKKRFLADRMAEVVSLDTAEVARGSDAEALLEQLVGRPGTAGRFGLVWLDQGGTLKPPEPDAVGATALRELVEGEIAAAHGGGRLRRIGEAVAEALAELVTAQRGQRRGPYLAAHRANEAAVMALARARADYGEADLLIARLVELDEAFVGRHGPAARDARLQRLIGAEEALASAREIVQQREIARTKAAEARSAASLATSQVRALGDRLGRLDRLMSLSADPASEEEREAKKIRLERELKVAREKARTAQQSRAALELEVKAVGAAMRERTLAARLARARELELAAERHRRSSAAAPRDPAALKSAREVSQRIAEVSGRLDANAVRITVTYAPGATAMIEYAGAQLTDGRVLTADRRVLLEIPGVGQVEIEPGASSERVALEIELTEARRTLDRILSPAGVPDLPGLEAAFALASRDREALAVIGAELKALVPEGRDALERLYEEAAAAARSFGKALSTADAPIDLAALEAKLAEARTAAVLATEGLSSCERAWDEMSRDIAVSAAASAERERERLEIETGLPPPEQRKAKLAELDGQARLCEAALDEALRVVSAWESRMSDPRMLELAEAEVVEARTMIERAEEQSARLRAERAHVEGALEALRREDVAERLALAEAEAGRCAERLIDIEEEVAALQVLAAELGAEEQRTGDLYSKPIAERLTPLLEMVFPGAALHLDRDYRITGFTRAGRMEELVRLSDGTREQVAVLVRLAFARLLADRGQSVPLILDDALVFADDERIQRMYRALEAGASTHQVIVLSCREQAFAGLRGHRVTLEPWHMRSA